MAKSSGRRAVVALGLAAVVAGAVAVAATGQDDPDPPGQAPDATSASQRQSAAPQAGPPALTDDQARQLEQALSSADKARLTDALVLPDGQPLDPALAASLAELGLQVDASTFQSTSQPADGEPATGTVRARATTAAPPSDWTVHLLHDGGTWQILSTEPAP